MGGTGGRDDALRGQMASSRWGACRWVMLGSVPPARRVDGLDALPDHKIAGAIRHRSCLLRLNFHHHKPHGWTEPCLRDRLRIGQVVLLPLHAGRRDQPDLAAKITDRSAPVLSDRAGRHRRDAGRLVGE
ncbi:MAG: hypothetical protein ACI807_003846 [Paracoccaceae bacterium]|jgi:hypothetical protein